MFIDFYYEATLPIQPPLQMSLDFWISTGRPGSVVPLAIFSNNIQVITDLTKSDPFDEPAGSLLPPFCYVQLCPMCAR